MRSLKNVTLLLAASSISACGGGGGASGPTFGELAAKGNNLIDTYALTAPTAVMPPIDSATYTGVAAYSFDSSDPAYIAQYADTVSELEMTADFKNSALTGRAYNFQASDPEISMSGTLSITDGVIEGNQFAADISGTMTERYRGYTANGSFNGGLSGEFVGENAEAIRGTGAASAFYTTDVPGFETYSDTVYAVFGAER